MNLFKKLWNDDDGAILAVEWTMLAGVTVLGVSAGAVAVRDAVNLQMQNIAGTLTTFVPTPNYSGWRNSVAAVPGFQQQVVYIPVTVEQVAPSVVVQQLNLLPAP